MSGYRMGSSVSNKWLKQNNAWGTKRPAMFTSVFFILPFGNYSVCSGAAIRRGVGNSNENVSFNELRFVFLGGTKRRSWRCLRRKREFSLVKLFARRRINGKVISLFTFYGCKSIWRSRERDG